MTPINSTKPTNHDYLVVRSGCWIYADPAWVRAPYRSAFASTDRSGGLSFRIHLSHRRRVTTSS